ncbi:hypothetical protein GCM10009745_24100 [Kribbella yunnanensis]|uniref:Uncharacterized protein n=1 Tax=Kribbella yunnanensis TaxID=190194 RepID=A0ABP4SYT4_9ACTN
MRVKRVVLVGGLLLATALGVAGGYYAGELTKPSYPIASGVPAPLGGVSVPPTTAPLPRKTPVPNGYEALFPEDLKFHWQTYNVEMPGQPAVRLRMRVPVGWKDSVIDKGQIKITDPKGVRWIRLATVYPIKLTPKQKRDQLIPGLKANVAYENTLEFLGQSDDSITGTDGQPRQVSVLRYRYIPDQWTRPVIVQYINTPGQDGANVEMSVVGLPQDQKALDRIAEEAAASVTPKD